MSYQFDSRIATCSSESWMTNSLGQSPCQVGTVLALRACGQDRYYLGTLNPPDYAYADVSAEEATPCRCNTVSFMLISACAICQSGQNADWISYSRNCWGTVTQPSQGVYPGTLPSGIAVPAWAYWVPGRPNFQFSTAIAKDFAGPDSTRPGSSPSTSTTPPSSTSTEAAGTTTNASGTTSTTETSTGTSSTTSGTGTSTTGTSTGTTGTRSGTSGPTATGDDVAIPSDAPQQGNSGSNTTGGSDPAQGTSRPTNVGAIAGGVVGGVIALLLLGLLVICLLRRRRARANLREDHPEMSAVQGGGGVAIDAGHAYDDSELPPDYAAVYGGDSSATGGVEDSIEEASSADAQAASTSRLVPAGPSTSKFPDPHAPIPSRRIQSVHKSPLPLP